METIINIKELKNLIGEGNELHLVEALPPKYFEQGHLPLAVNIPLESDDDLITMKLVNLQSTIVTYCTGKTCPNSGKLANRLRSLGYKNVFAFEGGKEEWVKSGNKLTREVK